MKCISNGKQMQRVKVDGLFAALHMSLNGGTQRLQSVSGMRPRAFGLVFTLPDDLQDVYLNVFINELAKRNGEPSWQLPMPARFVIDRGAIIRAAEADPDYTVRPEPEETVAILKMLA
jgi:hypothetical protein